MSPRPLLLGRFFAFVALFLVASTGPLISVDDGAMVGVAYYSPRPEFKPDVTRIFVILEQHHIHAVTTESASAQINVPSVQAAEARKLIADAIKREKLHITLLP